MWEFATDLINNVRPRSPNINKPKLNTLDMKWTFSSTPSSSLTWNKPINNNQGKACWNNLAKRHRKVTHLTLNQGLITSIDRLLLGDVHMCPCPNSLETTEAINNKIYNPVFQVCTRHRETNSECDLQVPNQAVSVSTRAIKGPGATRWRKTPITSTHGLD